MGWKNSPLLLCTATEPVADLANKSLRSHQPSRPHKLYNRAEAVAPPPGPPLANEHTKLTRNPYLRRPKAKLVTYVDVFVYDFLGLAQVPRHHRRHVRRMLFHALDKVFRPLDRQETKHRKEVLSLKNWTLGTDLGPCARPCLGGLLTPLP